MSKNNKILAGLVGIVMLFVSVLVPFSSVSAFTVTPQDQEYTLMPGQSVTGEVSAVNASDAEGKFYYIAEVVPYTVSSDGSYSPDFSAEDDYTDIINWVTLSDADESGKTTVHGVLEPGETGTTYYTIKVPENARGGGQYFAIRVKTDVEAAQKATEGSLTIREVVGIASLVFVEISGDITVKGEITDNNIPSFFTQPPINTSFTVRNEGNTHALISYYLQVFPLFSNEEVYTTEENPEHHYVLPGSSRTVTQSWSSTPSVGIFKVRQTVYYDSMDTEPNVTEKLVIVCPLWLIFIIAFIIVAIIVWLIIRIRSHKKSAEDDE